MTKRELLEAQLSEAYDKYMKPIHEQIKDIEFTELQEFARKTIGKCYKSEGRYIVVLDFINDRDDQRFKVFDFHEYSDSDAVEELNLEFNFLRVSHYYFHDNAEITYGEFIEAFKRVTYRVTSLLYEIEMKGSIVRPD